MAKRQRSKNKDWRNTEAYFRWRREVLQKSNYKCVITGSTGILVCHHLSGGAVNRKVRFAVTNGVALTPQIHSAYHRWWGFMNTATRESFKIFEILYRKGAFQEVSGEYFLKSEYRNIRKFTDL